MSIIIKIKDEEYSSFEEFGRNIYKYYDEAYKLINTTKFLALLKKENQELYEAIIKLRKEESNEDVFTFKVQYLFCPLMELKFRTYRFNSLKILGRKILLGAPKIDIYIQEVIKHKLISYYLKLQGYDVLEKKLYEEVLEVEKEYEDNPNRCYFKMGFVLAQTRKIVYRRRWYDNTASFFEEVLKPTTIHVFSQDFEKNQYIFAWLELLGYKDKINKYISLVETTEKWEDENDVS